MTEEEIQALRDELNEAKESIEALSNKNREVILKNKKLSSQNSEINSDEHYKIMDENEALKEQNKKLEHTIKGKDKEIIKLSDTNKSLDDNLRSVKIDGGLKEALVKSGVKKELFDGAMALLKPQATLVDGNAVIDEKPLIDGVNEWIKGDIGKFYVSAPDNSGAGSNGGNNGGGESQDKPQTSKEMFQELGFE